jgi:hypothetical protein
LVGWLFLLLFYYLFFFSIIWIPFYPNARLIDLFTFWAPYFGLYPILWSWLTYFSSTLEFLFIRYVGFLVCSFIFGSIFRTLPFFDLCVSLSKAGLIVSFDIPTPVQLQGEPLSLQPSASTIYSPFLTLSLSVRYWLFKRRSGPF